MSIPDHISESLETIFLGGSKILKFFDADADPESGIFLSLVPGSGMEKVGFGIRDKHPGSATLVSRDDHCWGSGSPTLVGFSPSNL
jgi:hypothetical protein